MHGGLQLPSLRELTLNDTGQHTTTTLNGLKLRLKVPKAPQNKLS